MKNVINQQDSEDNSYCTPQAELAVNDQTNAPNYKLYKPIGVGVATFLFSAVGGGIVLAINFNRLGKPQYAARCILGGILCVLTLIALYLALPSNSPDFILTTPQALAVIYVVTQLLGIVYIAHITQAKSIRAHVNAGGALESNWKIVGVLVLLVCLCIVIPFSIVAYIAIIQSIYF